MKLNLGDSVCLVTGAASGIGAALALELADKGARLALLDRDAAGLDAVCALVSGKTQISKHTLDLHDSAAIAALPAAVQAAHGRLTVLINNAGVAIAGPFERYGLEQFEWLMNVNFWACIRLTHAFLPMLRAQPVAQIAYLSSVYGLIGVAGNSAYCASKFAIRGFGEALRQELMHTSVGVTIVHPGGVNTNIARSARAAAGVDPALAAQRMAKLQRSLRLAPTQAAARIIAGVEHRRRRVLIGIDAHAADALQRIAPAVYGDLIGEGAARATPGLLP